jgi:hypothetical protein
MPALHCIGLQREAEVLRIPFDGGFDVIDHIANMDGCGWHVDLTSLSESL